MNFVGIEFFSKSPKKSGQGLFSTRISSLFPSFSGLSVTREEVASLKLRSTAPGPRLRSECLPTSLLAMRPPPPPFLRPGQLVTGAQQRSWRRVQGAPGRATTPRSSVTTPGVTPSASPSGTRRTGEPSSSRLKIFCTASTSAYLEPPTSFKATMRVTSGQF